MVPQDRLVPPRPASLSTHHPGPSPHLGSQALQAAGASARQCVVWGPRLPTPLLLREVTSAALAHQEPGPLLTWVGAVVLGVGRALGVVCLSCMNWRLSRRPPKPTVSPSHPSPAPGETLSPPATPGAALGLAPGVPPLLWERTEGPYVCQLPPPFPFPQWGPHNRDGHGERVDRALLVWERDTRGSAQVGPAPHPGLDNQIPKEGRSSQADRASLCHHAVPQLGPFTHPLPHHVP